MENPHTAPGSSLPGVTAEEMAAAAAAGGCPVDHSALTTQQSVVPASSLGGPEGAPMLQALKYFRNSSKFMTECRERYGSRFRINIVPGKEIYAISDPDEVKTIFLAPRDVLHTGNGSEVIEKFTGQTGLAWQDEDEHTARRKTLMPSLKGDALQRIETSATALARKAVASWPRNKVVSLHPYVHRFTTEVIREVVFGKVVPSCWQELFDGLMDMMDFNRRKASMIMLHRVKPRTIRLLRALRPLGVHDFLKARERVDELIAQAVKERLDSGDLGDDMLSVLLAVRNEDGSPLSGVELRDELMTMFLAGTETTAAAICWALEFLSREPAVLDRVMAEMAEGESDAYLTAVVHEVLRLRPPTPQIIPREVMKPIEVGGVRYEPGMLLWPSGYLVNRDPARYPEPDEFRPERFLNVKPGSYTWIPFGGGHIRCLGDRIAIFEAKTMLREVLTACELRRPDPRPETPRNRTVVLVPEHGTRLELRPRNRKAKVDLVAG
ncbi:cytochrome P450 [Streptomyces sp. B1866]|uniref:cytochrome P450 n=1 Tax=Streptomyces sp. B1866 TaxID=3075431 RepID=UPI00288E88A3|nr:cytochrome P450 [Streptomyces sp. B1866]MDT3398007.1 cytochrome P450 [Streptomyces sp. B1866]